MLNRIKFTWLSVVLLALFALSGYPALARNIARVSSMRELFACLRFLETDQVGYVVWATIPLPGTAACPEVLDASGGADIAVISIWLSEQQALPELLERITPLDRRQVYLWRNGEEDGRSPELTLFLANLSISAWNHDATEQTLTLMRQTLARPGREQAADLLTRSIGFRDDAESYTQFRLLMAEMLPDFIPNYADWFESMRVYQQWASAEMACQRLRLYARPPYDSLAATCQAQLLYFLGQYADAYANLQSELARRPHDPMVLVWAGVNARMLERYEECESLLEQAIMNEPGPDVRMGIYWTLGDCQRALGKTMQARQSYETALRYASDELSRSKHLRLLEEMQMP